MQIKKSQIKVTRIISWFTALIMLLSFIPMQVSAYTGIYDEQPTEPHTKEQTSYPNGNDYETSDEEYDDKDIAPEALMPLEEKSIAPFSTVLVNSWAALQAAVGVVGAITIEITEDITIPTGAAGNAITIPPNADITLTGGHTLLRPIGSVAQRHFMVNGILRLEDVTLSGSYSAGNASNHGGVLVNAGGSLYMEDGSAIINNRNIGNTNAPAVYVTGANATFTMNGGEISGNSAFGTQGSGGSAVFVENTAIFTMNGGVIRHNTSRFGGAVRIGTGAATPAASATRMYMTGGEIYGNTAFFGGGINVERGTLTMTQGVIHSNSVTGTPNAGNTFNVSRGGGGVFIQNDGIFYMHGGTISHNYSDGRGGGVHMLGGTFTMTSGTISHNTANNTGNLDLPLANPRINLGGGVAVQGPFAIFNMHGGTITENTATHDGGGIWVNTGNATAGTGARLNMTSGTITNNTATTGYGGGIFANPTSTVAVLPPNAYQNIISANGTFSGNTAGQGRSALPTNAYTRSFGHLLNNYDINYMSPNPLVTFVLNGGHVGGSAENIFYTIDPPNTAIGESNVPTPERVGYHFLGWLQSGATAGSVSLSNMDVGSYIVDTPITFYAQWLRIIYIVTFDLAGGTGNFPDQHVYHGGTATMPVSEPTRINWDFNGWDWNFATQITTNVTITAQWEPQSDNSEDDDNSNNSTSWVTPDNWGPHLRPHIPRLYYELNDPYLPILRSRYPGLGFRAKFMIGFPDGNFKPNGYLTRAEAAALLVRTMTTTFGVNVPRRQVHTIPYTWGDVSPGTWYYEYIAIAYSYGLVRGFETGNFQPNTPITREQFAGMLARGMETAASGILPYMDAADVSDWAYDYIYSVLALGLMHGDANGIFRPAGFITRAETAAAMSRILGRGELVSGSRDVSHYKIFPDAENRDAWYFLYVVEATNSYWFIEDNGEGALAEDVTLPQRQ